MNDDMIIPTTIVNSRENDDAYYMFQSITPLLKHWLMKMTSSKVCKLSLLEEVMLRMIYNYWKSKC